MALEQIYLTRNGAELLARAQMGVELKFTRGQIGEGTMPPDKQFADMTALAKPLKYLNISKNTISKEQVKIECQFTNAGINKAFLWYEFGIWAENPDFPDDRMKDILYAYCNAVSAEQATPIPQTLTEFMFNSIFKIQNASNVTAIIDDSLVYLTNEMLDRGLSAAVAKAVAGGTGSAITAGVQEIAELLDGQQLTIKMTKDIAAGATLKLNGGTAYPICMPDGTPVSANIAKMGSFLPLSFNATLKKWFVTGGGGMTEEQAEQIQTMADALDAAISDIELLQTASGTHTSDITKIKGDVSTLKSDVGTLKTDTGKLKTDVSALQTASGTHTSDITKLKSDVGTLQTTTGKQTTDITALKTDIGALQTDVVAHKNNKSNPHGVTKAQVGLGNADNTADTVKPVSTAQTAAIATAKSEAITAAAADATAKANKAKTDAETAAAADAKTKADAAQAAAISAAAADATAKANKAETNAKAASVPLSTKGKANGVATLDASGKVPAGQLPPMNYDPAGSAGAVQANLNNHTADKTNPHGVTAEQAGAIPETDRPKIAQISVDGAKDMNWPFDWGVSNVVAGNGMLLATSMYISETAGSKVACSYDNGATWYESSISDINDLDNPVCNDDIWLIKRVSTEASNFIYWSGDGKTWTKSTLTSNVKWRQPVWNGSVWVTCSNINSDSVAWSADGKTWNAATLPSSAKWNQPVWNGSVWVTCGSNGTAAAWSADGKMWNAATLPSNTVWYQPVWNGEIWVMCGSTTKAVWSTNGKTWTAATMPASTYWHQPVWNGSVWVTCDNSGGTAAAWSADGKTWTAATLPASLLWNKPVTNGSIFVVSASENRTTGTSSVAWSADGKTWTAATFPFMMQMSDPIWNGKYWFASGKGLDGSTEYSAALWSEDGKTWSADRETLPSYVFANTPTVNGNTVLMCCGEPVLYAFDVRLKTGENDVTPGMIGAATNKETLQLRDDFEAKALQYTDDISVWEDGDDLPPAEHLGWHTPIYNGMVWVTVSSFSNTGETTTDAMWSEDGKKWNAATLPSGSIGWEQPVWNGVIWVTTSAKQTAAWSEDGKTWNQVNMPVDAQWNRPAWNGNVFVATSNNKNAAWSEDGKTWNATTFASGAYWRTPVWDAVNGLWITIADSTANAAWSADGKTWNMVTLTTASWWADLACFNGVWVLCSVNATNVVLWSADGKTWTQGTMPAEKKWCQPVTNGTIMITCNDYQKQSLALDTVAWSEDGKTWTAATFPIAAKWKRPQWTGTVWITTVNDYFSNITPQFAWSADGKTWNGVNITGATSLYNDALIVDGDIVLISTSNSPAFVSRDDGKTWSKISIRQRNWTMVAYVGGVAMAFATYGEVAYQTVALSHRVTPQAIGADPAGAAQIVFEQAKANIDKVDAKIKVPYFLVTNPSYTGTGTFTLLDVKGTGVMEYMSCSMWSTAAPTGILKFEITSFGTKETKTVAISNGKPLVSYDLPSRTMAMGTTLKHPIYFNDSLKITLTISSNPASGSTGVAIGYYLY